MTLRSKTTVLAADLVARLRAITGAQHALLAPHEQLPYLREWRDMYEGRASIVLRPGSTEEVSQILALANEYAVPVVPQAGNTGLVGGQIPMNGEILLSVGRLRRVRAMDAAQSSMTVESGLTLAEVQAAAEREGRLFPLSLPSEGTCQIGGNLATNAGGVGVLAYGNMRQLALGLEVVLADGRIWNGLKALKKDNSGYDLRDLFIGSEGTLGVITAAVLKLFPLPAEKATAIVALQETADALKLFNLVKEEAGTSLTAFEFMPRIGLDFVMLHVAGAREPFATKHAWYAILEISSLHADATALRLMTEMLQTASDRGFIRDAALASSLAQARDFWRLRDAISQAQKPEGGNIKHDVSVPIAQIPLFITRANALVESLCPGARPLAFGHLGDGSVHYNIAQPPGMAKADFMGQWNSIADAVHALVVNMGGSISAEHGIGQMKRTQLADVKAGVELDLMRRIKSALDPKGILNPGKVL
jgi:FAD/FMN-containing dehydrogenase